MSTSGYSITKPQAPPAPPPPPSAPPTVTPLPVPEAPGPAAPTRQGVLTDGTGGSTKEVHWEGNGRVEAEHSPHRILTPSEREAGATGFLRGATGFGSFGELFDSVTSKDYWLGVGRSVGRPERVTSASAWAARRTKGCPDDGSTTARSPRIELRPWPKRGAPAHADLRRGSPKRVVGGVLPSRA